MSYINLDHSVIITANSTVEDLKRFFRYNKDTFRGVISKLNKNNKEMWIKTVMGWQSGFLEKLRQQEEKRRKEIEEMDYHHEIISDTYSVERMYGDYEVYADPRDDIFCPCCKKVIDQDSDGYSNAPYMNDYDNLSQTRTVTCEQCGEAFDLTYTNLSFDPADFPEHEFEDED